MNTIIDSVQQEDSGKGERQTIRSTFIHRCLTGAVVILSAMPRPWEFKDKFEFVTADFVFVRWLGDRKGIEERTRTWDRTVVDRRNDLVSWVELLAIPIARRE